MTHSHAPAGTASPPVGTVSPPAGTVSPPVGTVSLAAQLHAHGMRMTPQRQRVVDAVSQLTHATPDQVAELVPDVDLTTVYRTLEKLEQIGVLAHTHLGHGPPSYRLASDDHLHVVCHTCSSVVNAPPGLADELISRLADERGFTVDRSHLTVFGTCASCRTAQQNGEAAGHG